MLPEDFANACEQFVHTYSKTSYETDLRGFNGWTWVPHSIWPGLGYMTRNAASRAIGYALVDPDIEEVEDQVNEAVASSSNSNDMVNILQYVAYSPSFQVPAFYFIVSDRNGTPVPLETVVQSGLFKRSVLSNMKISATSVATEPEDLTASIFPILTQGDHPALHTTCWYIHPCDSPRAVEELLAARRSEGEEMGALQWLEMWFMVLGTIVNL